MGDVLVIILIYCFFKSFYNFNTKKLAFAVLLFSFFVEMLQYFHIADILNIQNKVIRIITGTAFEYTDLLAYFIGYIIILGFEYHHKILNLCR